MMLSFKLPGIPVEDFRHNPGQAFNYKNDAGSSFVAHGWSTSFFTDDAVMTHGSGTGPVPEGYWDYAGIRQLNEILLQIKTASIAEADRKELENEAHFIRAYMYFGLVKRYGGVPVIKEPLAYVPGSDNANLFIPGNTGKETWDFILEECDLAAASLPATVTAADSVYRATRWAALALKPRTALHAASIAKYWSKAPLAGEAVDKKLAGGMTAGDADSFYQKCIDASNQNITNGGKTLFRPSLATAADAAKNYQALFMNPESSEAKNEIIFSKNYIDGSVTSLQGHCYDVHFNPSQTGTVYLAYGRFSVNLNLIDVYEDYKDDGTGRSVKIVTRTDGNENYTVPDPTTWYYHDFHEGQKDYFETIENHYGKCTNLDDFCKKAQMAIFSPERKK